MAKYPFSDTTGWSRTLGRQISGYQEQVVLLDLLDQEYRYAMKRCNPLHVLGVDGEEVGRYDQLPCQFKNFWVDSVAAPVRVSIPYTPVRRTAVRFHNTQPAAI